MKHLFDVEIAKSYGIDVAVFLENLSFWIIKNQANKEHFHDGRYWTYNSLDAFTVIFPYLSKKQIRRIIDKSFKEDLIVKGNYNQIGYDRTVWYSLSDKGHALFGMEICPNEQIDMPKWAHQNVQTGTPIPYINTDNKPDIKDKDKAQRKKRVDAVSEQPIVLPDWLPNEVWEEFKQHRKDMKKPMSVLAQKKTINQLEKMRERGQDIQAVIDQSIANGWQGLFELKSQGKNHGKDSKYYGPTGKFDATQYLLDSIRADESKEANRVFESNLPFEDCKHLFYDGTS